MKVLGPHKFKFLDEPVLKESIKKINKSMKVNHGLFSFCEVAVLEKIELPKDLRNRISKIYIKKGWNYVYHAVYKELPDNGHTTTAGTIFLFSQKPILKKDEEDIESYTLISKDTKE